MNYNELAQEGARALGESGVEGGFGSVSCSTNGDYPSMGFSQWEGLNGRGDFLLSYIDGGAYFAGRTFSDLENTVDEDGISDIQKLSNLLDSEQGHAAQIAIVNDDMLNKYVPLIASIAAIDPFGNTVGFNDTRCVLYALTWCPTSHSTVATFIKNRIARGYDMNDLKTLAETFYNEYAHAADCDDYILGYQNRANTTYRYIVDMDLSAYGIPVYVE